MEVDTRRDYGLAPRGGTMLTYVRCSTLLGIVALLIAGASCGNDSGSGPGPGNGGPDASNPTPDASNPSDDVGNPSVDANLTGVDRFRQICMTQGTPITHVR